MSRRPGSSRLALLVCFGLASVQLSAQMAPNGVHPADEQRSLAAMHGISSNALFD